MLMEQFVNVDGNPVHVISMAKTKPALKSILRQNTAHLEGVRLYAVKKFDGNYPDLFIAFAKISIRNAVHSTPKY